MKRDAQLPWGKYKDICLDSLLLFKSLLNSPIRIGSDRTGSSCLKVG